LWRKRRAGGGSLDRARTKLCDGHAIVSQAETTGKIGRWLGHVGEY